MVLTQELVFGTITSNTGSGTQNDPVIIQGKNGDSTSELLFASSVGEYRIIVEPGTKVTLYVKFKGDNNTLVQLKQNNDNSTIESIMNPAGEYERTYVDINTLLISFFLQGQTTELPFNIEYYYIEETSTSTPRLNWQVRRPTYSNNALVFYKSGTANGAVGSVVNSRVISRRT